MDIAEVGSWKLEKKPGLLKRVGKTIEHGTRTFTHKITGNHKKLKEVELQKESGYYSLFQKNSQNLNCNTNTFYYLRSHCALYRTDLIKKYNLSFTGGEGTSGSLMHSTLVKNNYKMIFLSVDFLSRYLVHLNHATMVLNPELGAKKNTVQKGVKRNQKELKRLNAHEVLKDSTLDK